VAVDMRRVSALPYWFNYTI